MLAGVSTRRFEGARPVGSELAAEAPLCRSPRPARLALADLGIDWAPAAWCALGAGGELTEGAVSADVRDRLAECDWAIEIADARKRAVRRPDEWWSLPGQRGSRARRWP